MYIEYVWFVNEWFVGNIVFKWTLADCLHMVKWFQELLSKIDIFIFTQLNGIRFYSLAFVVLFCINHLFAQSFVDSAMTYTEGFNCTQ